MINFSHNENFIYLKNVPREDASMMELHHSAVYSRAQRHWRLPLNRHVMSDLWHSFPELRRNEKFIQLGTEVKMMFDRQIELRKICEDLDGYVLHPELRPYQCQDALYLANVEAGGIFNDPRTGKTPTAITVMQMIGHMRNLVVCPASLTYNWKREIEKWWPKASTSIVEGSKEKRYAKYRKHSEVIIVSKDTLKMDIEDCKVKRIEYSTCFVDEAHFLRNYKTAQAKAVFAINAKRRYAITGTPSANHAIDVWGILHFLHPRQYPSYWQTAERYFQVNDNMGYGGKTVGWAKPKRIQEFQECVGLIAVQRKRRDVMAWLPKKQYQTIACKMDDKQLALYEEMRDFFTATDGEQEIDTATILAQLMRLRQLCLDPRLLGFSTPGAKTKVLLEYIENRSTEPLVVMSMFTSYLKMISPEVAKLGRRVAMIHGEMSATQKDEVVRQFQAGKIDVLLCNIISAGVGLTMDRSNTILFIDRSWNPIENEQAEDRICPVSEDRNHAHNVIDLDCADSIDEIINDTLRKKKSLISIVNEGGMQAIRKLMEGV